MTESFTLSSPFNAVSALLVTPGEKGRHPCVILSHGLISSKESSKYVEVSDRLAGAGFASCRFDYHGCGESGGRIEETTLTIRIANLAAVIDHVAGHPRVDGGRLGVLGSSFGGSTALVTAARDSRIRCTSLWATPHSLGRKEDDTSSEIDFRQTLYDDFAAYDLLAEAEKITRCLVVHGDEDEVVPWQHGVAIFARLRHPKDLEIVRGGDHVLSDPAQRSKAIARAVAWFRSHL